MMVYYAGFLSFPLLLCCKNVGFDFWEGLAVMTHQVTPLIGQSVVCGLLMSRFQIAE